MEILGLGSNFLRMNEWKEKINEGFIGRFRKLWERNVNYGRFYLTIRVILLDKEENCGINFFVVCFYEIGIRSCEVKMGWDEGSV